MRMKRLNMIKCENEFICIENEWSVCICRESLKQMSKQLKKEIKQAKKQREIEDQMAKEKEHSMIVIVIYYVTCEVTLASTTNTFT